MRSGVGRAVCGPGRLDRIERLADGSVADRVEVDLETGRVQSPDVVAEGNGFDEAETAPVARGAATVEVRLDHRPREVLQHSVLHDLYRVCPEAPYCSSSRALDELVDLLATAVGLPPHGALDPGGQLPALGGRSVGLLILGGDDRVLPRRDPEGVEICLPDP